MIRSDLGRVEIEGSMNTILSEYCLLTRNLRRVFSEKMSAEEAEEQLKDAFEKSFLSEEELHKMAKQAILKMFEGGDIQSLAELLKEAAEAYRKGNEVADE